MKILNNRSRLIVIGAIVSAFAVLAIVPNVLSNKTENEEESKRTLNEVSEKIPQVIADGYLVENKILDDEIHTTGTVLANQEVNLVSEVARKVTAVYSREGSYVKKGALLFKLDDADLQARKKKLVLQEKLALLEEKRFRELLATESANQQEYDQVLTNLEVLQSEIEALDVELAKTEIRAPFSGKIGLNKIDVGAYVTPSTSLSYIEDVSQVKIVFTVPEKYVADIKQGQQILFTTESSPSPFIGVIVATESKTDLNTRSLLVQAKSKNLDGKLVPGTSAKVIVKLHQIQDGILIPTEALIPTPEGYALFAVKNGQAEKKEVKTGIRTKATIQILDGLSVGDTVITSNLLRLGPGVAVDVVGLN